jgi:predicted nicotinamide N-methyase
MKFCNTEVPQKLFDMTRERMRKEVTFTPEDIRLHLIKNAQAELVQISDITHNHQIIAERLMRACIKELRASGEIKQMNRGRWAKSSFLDSIK